MELYCGFVLRGWMLVGSVQDFGNEGLILDECETGGRFGSTECQLDECQRNKLTDLFDNKSFAENAFVHDKIMGEAVAVFRHSAPPKFFWFFRLWLGLESGRDSVCGSEVATTRGIPVFFVQVQAVD